MVQTVQPWPTEVPSPNNPHCVHGHIASLEGTKGSLVTGVGHIPYHRCPCDLKMAESVDNVEHIHSLYADGRDCHCGEEN